MLCQIHPRNSADSIPATSARLSSPRAVVVNSDLSWYIAGTFRFSSLISDLLQVWSVRICIPVLTVLHEYYNPPLCFVLDTGNHRIRKVAATASFLITVRFIFVLFHSITIVQRETFTHLLLLNTQTFVNTAGTLGSTGDGGTPAAARLNQPYDVQLASDG